MMSNDPATKRLLVLTSATGAGHDTHAFAAAEWCRRLYGPRVQVHVAHALEDSHRLYRYGVDFYNFIQRRTPWFHHAYYNVVELLELLNPGTVGLGRSYYVRLLKETQPDAILSVMDCLNRGYFELAKEVLGAGVKCATYCPEFEGGYGFSRNWVNPRGDYFFGRTEATREEGVRRGFRTENSRVAGHWAPPSFYEKPLSLEAKALYLRDKLGLEPGRFTLLLSTGGAGAENHAAILRALSSLEDSLQVIALCGRDERQRERLEEWARRNCPVPLCALGFSEEMPMLLGVSSAVVARAGATTAGEALLCGCPVIFNALGGMMPQELPTWRYFRRYGIGFAASRPTGVRDVVERWLREPDVHARLRARMGEAGDPRTPEASLALLLDGV